MSTPAPRVTLSIEGVIATVRLNRPDKHNGMDVAMIEALIATAKQLKKNRDIRVVILTGEGPSFCAGIDTKSMFSGSALKPLLAFVPLLKPIANKYQNVSLIWRTLSVPVIAAIHGSCFGAGMQLALGADIRIATPDAKLSVMEAKWGLIPDMGGMVTMRDHLPRDVAFELTATGRVLAATEAQALGLVTRIEDDPLAAAKAMATLIVTRSPDASAAAKRMFRQSWSASEYKALAAERRWQLRMILGKNQRIATLRNTGKPDTAYQPRQW